jgi:glutamyl-tRNA synthetase
VGFADEEIGKLARLYLEEAATTKELREKMKPIFGEKEIPKELEETAQRVRSVIQKAPYFETYDDFKSYVAKETGLKEEQLVKILRLLLSGAEHGPDLSRIYAHGKNYLGEIVK